MEHSAKAPPWPQRWLTSRIGDRESATRCLLLTWLYNNSASHSYLQEGKPGISDPPIKAIAVDLRHTRHSKYSYFTTRQVGTMSANGLVPKGAWDTHIHVFDPEKFPYATPRSYTPKAAAMAEYPSQVTGCTGIVVVHASTQGASPAALLDTLSKQKSMPGFILRGLATIDVDNITDAELDQLHAAGVRGARLHEMAWGHGEQKGESQIMKKIQALANRLARLGWVIGVFCPLGAWAGMAEMIRGLDPRVKMVADHFGSTFPGDENTAEFQTLLALIREKRLFVKFSGFERLYHGHAAGMDTLEKTAKAILEAGPDQVVFGSDWPHTQLGVSRKGKTDEQRLNDIEGFREVPDLAHIKKLREWIPDDEQWQKLFVTNPERLFS